jgi:hypothetical protein
MRPAASVNGAGSGLRSVHVPFILEHRPPIGWFEILIDNFLYTGESVLDRIRESYAIAFHSVGLDVGSVDPPDRTYLRRLGERVRRFEPAFVSTHLCWSGAGGHFHHDLLPLPFTEECVAHCADRIGVFQDYLGERILIENVSSYLQFRENAMSEVEFLRAVAERADCHILADINNIYVNFRNHGGDPVQYMEALPAERVRQLHLAGYEDRTDYLLDTHGAPIAPAVWELFEQAVDLWGPVPTAIERDANIPPDFADLAAEVARAQAVLEQCY